jgi:uridylate kinase
MGEKGERPVTVEYRYQRIVVKISGESLAGSRPPLDPERVNETAQSLASIQAMGIHMAIVVGGGNIMRADQAATYRMTREQADEAGMYGTGYNALALFYALENIGMRAQIFSRGAASGIGVPYYIPELCSVIRDGQVAIIAGGAGVGGTSTDMPAVQTADDIKADVVIMAKNGVEGVLEADPRHHANPELIPELTASEALEKKLRVMDFGAMTLARGCNIPIHVVGADDPNSVRLAIEGKEIGSIIYPS